MVSIPVRVSNRNVFRLILVGSFVVSLSGGLCAQQTFGEITVERPPKELDRISQFTLPAGDVTTLVVLPNSKSYFTGHADGRLLSWRTIGAAISQVRKFDSAVTALAISGDGKQLVVATKIPKVFVLELDSGKWIAEFVPAGTVDLVAISANIVAAKSTRLQLFDTSTSKVTLNEPVDPSVSHMAFLPISRALAYYAPKDGALKAVSQQGGQSPVEFHPQNLLRPQQKFVDLSFSIDGKVGVSAYEDGTLVPLTWSRFRPELETKVPGFKLRRALTTRDGGYAICLGMDRESDQGQGIIWDLMSNRRYVDLNNVPAKLKFAAADTKDRHLVIVDEQGTASVWELPPFFSNRGTGLLRGQVKYHPWDPNYDPKALLTLNNWTAEPTKDGVLPGFMKGALKLTPPQMWDRSAVPEAETVGRFYAVITLPDDADSTERQRQLRAHTHLVTGEGWENRGVCPWKPKATLYAITASKKSQIAPGLALDFSRDELYFVPGLINVSPEEYQKLPARLRNQSVRNQIHRWLIEKNYKKIEEFAEAARRTKETLVWGSPTLGAVYDGFTPSPELSDEQLQERILEYMGAEKGSVTAMVAAARRYTNLGFRARGTDVAASTSEEQNRKFITFLTTARQTLNTVSAKVENDPYWDAEYLQTMPIDRMDPDEIISITLRSLKKHPQCLAAVNVAANWLLPRWGGKPDSAGQLAERIRMEIPGDDGKALSAAFAVTLYRYEPERWNDDFGFNQAQFVEDAAILRKLAPEDDNLRVTTVRMSLASVTAAERRKLWSDLGSRVSLKSFGGLPIYTELNDRIEEVPRKELAWSSIESTPGKIAISPDGKNLIHVSHMGRLRFLSASDGSLVGEQQGPLLTTREAFLPSSNHAIIVFENGWCHFDNQTGVKQFAFPRQVNLYNLAVSKDGTRMVLTGDDGSIQFLDAVKGKLLASLPRGINLAEIRRGGVALTKDGKRAAIATADVTVTLFDTQTGKALSQLKSTMGDVRAMQFIMNDTRLAALTNSHAFEWKLAGQSVPWSADLPGGNLRLRVTEDGRYWAAATDRSTHEANEELLIYDRQRKPEGWRSIPEVCTTSSFVWHPTQPRLFVSSDSGVLTAWDVDKLPDGVTKPVETPTTAAAKTSWQGWLTEAPRPAIAPFDSAQARQHQEAWATYLNVPVEYTNTVGMKFRLIPPGEFLMGSTRPEIEEPFNRLAPTDTAWREFTMSEIPKHKVILSRPIYLGAHEVTQGEYEKLMGKNPSHFAPAGGGKSSVAKLDTASFPVELVTWNDAAEFCARLSQKEGLKPFYNRQEKVVTALDGDGYRMPSEAEWDMACRAGTTTRYWIGDRAEELLKSDWHKSNAGDRPHPVGQLLGNPFGLYDLHGNVCEYMHDGWIPSYYSQFLNQPAINPIGVTSPNLRHVIRGGYFRSDPVSARGVLRFSQKDVDPFLGFGFRVALNVDAVRQMRKVSGPALPHPATPANGIARQPNSPSKTVAPANKK
jgi:formylglycine-generating enzyme required for sulfatase activity